MAHREEMFAHTMFTMSLMFLFMLRGKNTCFSKPEIQKKLFNMMFQTKLWCDFFYYVICVLNRGLCYRY
jgi:hypothetical protein